MASYLDKLQNQIKYLPQLRNTTYLSASDKPYPFASNLVESAGLVTPEIFVDATILETIMDRDEDRKYSLDLDNVKNQIYQNIYNNLVYIYKSKGTEKAFRNLIHCYGVDDALVRLNTYANNLTYKFRDNFRTVSVAKSVVDFSEAGNNAGVIYQMTASDNANSVGYISGSDGAGKEDYIGFTLESEFIFPKKIERSQTTASVGATLVTSSLFGMHRPDIADSDETTWASSDYADLQVYAVRPQVDSVDAYFMLTSSLGAIPTLTSSVFKGVYDDTKWNFAVRLVNSKYPLGDFVTGVTASGASYSATTYSLEFYGLSSELDIVRSEFSSTVTGTIENSASLDMLRSAKRVYAGAHRTNFTGALLQSADTKLSSLRYWADYVPNNVIRAHARDIENYGTEYPLENAFLTQNALTGTYIPAAETLALNWNFYNLTSSNSSGEFVVEDYSSGSTSDQTRYGWYGNIVKAQHTGRGRFFNESSLKTLEKYYFNAARQDVPEIVQTSEMVNIMTDDSTYFDRDERPIFYYFSVEKSMYQTISDEMINTFATIVQFNNLIGDPINRYRQDYKLMEKARQLFFQNVENTPDLDKFIDFYKWIDASLSTFLQQLIPAAANASDSVRTLIESHVLERNKYWSKFPTLEKVIPPEGIEGAIASSEWEFSSPAHFVGLSSPTRSGRPISGLQSDHAPYWKIRAPRNKAPLASGIAGVDDNRETLRVTLASGYTRDQKRPASVSVFRQNLIHAGINYGAGKKRTMVRDAAYPHGPRAASGTPLNILLFDDQDVVEFQNIDDVLDPNEKKFYSFAATVRRLDETGVSNVGNDTYESRLKGEIAAPFNLLSSSATLGDYNDIIANSFKTGSSVVNLHSDTTTIDNEIPMQGPFTSVHVGGHQSRHVAINRYNSSFSTPSNLDDYTTRPEAWQMLVGEGFGVDSTFIGLAGADYPYPVGPYPYTPRQRATRYRNVLTKRPVNIANIKYTTASVNIGNYSKDYQIVQTSGRSANNRYFIDNGGITLPDLYKGITTTSYNYLNTKEILALSGTNGSTGAPGYKITTHASLNNVTAWSYSLWVSSSNTATTPAGGAFDGRYLMSIGSSGGASWGNNRAIAIEPATNKLVFRAGYATTDGVWKSDSAIWSATGWFHIALTYADGDGDANLYINGSEVGGSFTTPPAGALSSETTDSTLLCLRDNSIGRVINNSSFYSGSVAEASYWNKKLSSAEVTEIYNRGESNDNPGPQNLTDHSAAANLVSWWRFGEGAGDTEMLIKDQVGSNDAAGIGLQADNGMELADLTAADLLIAGGGTYLVTTTSDLPQTTNVNTLIGINPQITNAGGNYFGHVQAAPSVLSNRFTASINYAVRGRTANDFIFVERFSAPGGPEINSLGYLDIMAEEKSVYNAIPFRNSTVLGSGSGEATTIRVQDQLNRRRGLRTLRALHAGPFGSDATYGSVPELTYVTSPSYQKNNRNPRLRIEFNGTASYEDGVSDAFVTGTVFDNDNVIHAIPRSANQYSWISASYSVNKTYGHPYGDGVYSSSAGGFEQSLQFITASQISVGGISVNFDGINALIYDPINLSENMVSASNADYRNTALATLPIAEMLNSLLLHRQGPYGVNSWRQTRGTDSALVRALRRNNIMSFYEKSGYSYPVSIGDRQPLQMRGALTNYTEAPLSSKYQPLTQILTVDTVTSDGSPSTENLEIDTSYANSLSAFSHVALNNSYYVSQSRPEAYTRIRDLYLNNSSETPVRALNSLTYRETVYPAVINMYSSSIRVRQNYANSFWRSSRANRNRIDATDLLDLSDATITQSLWSLDADMDFTTREVHNLVSSTGGAGVLQNEYSQFHSGTINNITASVQYARRHTVDSIASIASPVGGVAIHATGSSMFSGAGRFNPFVRGSTAIGLEQFYAGQALWEAASQSDRQPWYDNYDDYVQQMRLIGKDHSIIPSFRMSEHIARYTKELSGDFLADNLVFLQMTGGLGDRDKSDEELFYKTYTNSDFLKFFASVRADHDDVASPRHIRLECKALKKFIPYDGFYPSERMVQLGQQFSSSLAGHVKFTGTDSTNSNVAMRAFMAPFYAPGLAFNTIKSGIAVDYPMFSASMDTHDSSYKGAQRVGRMISGSNNVGQFHYRIPFEALIEPEKYIADKDIIDLEPHPSCSLDVTASWGRRGNSLYKMMASNFFAEVPEFFLPQEQFATIVSQPESRFLSVQNGEQFAARIKVYKSLNIPTTRTGSLGYRNPTIPRDDSATSPNATNPVFETFTMYSRPTAFGPPCGGGRSQFQGTAPDGYNLPFTPPYYNGECWADVIFTAPRTSTSDKPITLEDIFSPDNLSVSYKRIGNEWIAMAENTMYHSANVETNAMQMDASFNLFGRAQIKNLRYDPATGQPIEALDSTENVWVVQPKMETPMLNFSGASITLPTNGSASAPFGMWHQYGQLPDDPSKGIFLQVTDLPDNYIKYALGGDVDLTGSLADLVGFKTEPQRLGQVADSKVVREAIVAVPYMFEAGEKRFFPLSTDLVQKAERIVDFGQDVLTEISGEAPGQSIVNLVRAMKDFVFPPKMDFVKNKEAVEPFNMYVFQFEHRFSQQDLTNMWQNLLPQIGYSFDTNQSSPPDTQEVVSSVVVEHDLLTNELLSGNLDSKIQWMVFKVKQQANKNYFSKVIADEVNQVGRFNRDVGIQIGRDDSGKAFQPKYSYNWPYDFFSLIELVKLDASVTLDNTEDS